MTPERLAELRRIQAEWERVNPHIAAILAECLAEIAPTTGGPHA